MSRPPAFDAPCIVVDGIARYHAIEFAVIEGFRPLQLDLTLPSEGQANGAAVVYLHGGGWTVGTRRRFGRATKDWRPTPMERLAAAGFVVASVDYRLSAEAIFPAQLHDAKAAVRWVRANAAPLGVDGERIVAWGESAGGHLALLLGLTGDIEELHGSVGDAPEQRSDVCAVVAWYPVSDFSTLADQRHPESTTDYAAPETYESRLLGAPIAEAPASARAASPITYVRSGVPPIQLHHGDDDRVVPHAQSVALTARLEELGCEVELVTLPETDHFWINAPSVEAIFQASVAFAATKTAREQREQSQATGAKCVYSVVSSRESLGRRSK